MIANGRNLIFDLATRRVAHYRGAADRGPVDDGTRCEQSLAEGLDAIRWIRRADETMRAADYEGIFEYTNELQAAMKGLLNDWLQKAGAAAALAAELDARGSNIPALNQFRETLNEVREQVESGELSWPAGASLFADEPW